MSSPETLAALDLVWIPDAPLWLVRLVAGIEGLAALGLILPGLARELGPRRRDQLAGVVALAGRMTRKCTHATETRSRPPVLIQTGAEDHLPAMDETAETASLSDGSGRRDHAHPHGGYRAWHVRRRAGRRAIS